jgi:hypothetical protein
MPKQMVVTVGYQHYACSPEDAIRLLDIATRMVRVERRYPDIHRKVIGDDPLVTLAEIAEVGEPLADDRPDAAEPIRVPAPVPTDHEPF